MPLRICQKTDCYGLYDQVKYCNDSVSVLALGDQRTWKISVAAMSSAAKNISRLADLGKIGTGYPGPYMVHTSLVSRRPIPSVCITFLLAVCR